MTRYFKNIVTDKIAQNAENDIRFIREYQFSEQGIYGQFTVSDVDEFTCAPAERTVDFELVKEKDWKGSRYTLKFRDAYEIDGIECYKIVKKVDASPFEDDETREYANMIDTPTGQAILKALENKFTI